MWGLAGVVMWAGEKLARGQALGALAELDRENEETAMAGVKELELKGGGRITVTPSHSTDGVLITMDDCVDGVAGIVTGDEVLRLVELLADALEEQR